MMAGQPPKISIKTVAVQGKAKVKGGKVRGVIGDPFQVPSGSSAVVEEIGIDGEADVEEADVAARETTHGGKRSQADDEDSGITDKKQKGQKQHIEHFGGEKTTVLMIAGAVLKWEDSIDQEKDRKTFKKDLNDMRNLLIGTQIEIQEENIHQVLQRPNKRTKDAIEREIGKCVEDLKDTSDGRLIVYYTGHFINDNFLVDLNDTEEENRYSDEDFVNALEKIPAKFILFITDMCYSAAAKLRTRGDQAEFGSEARQELPRFVELYEKIINRDRTRGGGDDGLRTSTCEAEKVVQWAACGERESSGSGINGHFTRAIIDVIENTDTDPAGQQLRDENQTVEYATVALLNKYVLKNKVFNSKFFKENPKYAQTPVVKPKLPEEEAKEYFKSFPCFAKIR